jgi:hypothetical protein
MMAGVSLTVRVECYSGYKAEERPLRFSVETPRREVPEAVPRKYEVKEVLDQWYGPGYQCFKVRADDGNLYILRHNQKEDAWTLDAFRREKKMGSENVES